MVAVGSYLYWTADRPRAFRVSDWGIVSAGGLIVIGSFVAEGRAVVEERLPESYPAWLFWVGFLIALAWFGFAERRQLAA